jgi:hypothetical protein
VPDEHVGQAPLRDALGERRHGAATIDRCTGFTPARAAFGRQSRARASKLVHRHELATQGGVDVGVEHDRAQRACEVEERACRRSTRDAVPLVSVLVVVDVQALVDHEPVVTSTLPSNAHELGQIRSSRRQGPEAGGGTVRRKGVGACSQARNEEIALPRPWCTPHPVHAVVDEDPASTRDARLPRSVREFESGHVLEREHSVLLGGEASERLISATGHREKTRRLLARHTN